MGGKCSTKMTGKNIIFLYLQRAPRNWQGKDKSFNSKMDKRCSQNDQYTWEYLKLAHGQENLSSNILFYIPLLTKTEKTENIGLVKMSGESCRLLVEYQLL